MKKDPCGNTKEESKMTTYYHVTATSYQDGDDLLSFQERLNLGEVTESDWKWDHDLEGAPDAQFVSLWSDLERAKKWIEEMVDGDAVIVEVVDDGTIEVRTAGHEATKHPCVYGKIPGRLCAIIEGEK